MAIFNDLLVLLISFGVVSLSKRAIKKNQASDQLNLGLNVALAILGIIGWVVLVTAILQLGWDLLK